MDYSQIYWVLLCILTAGAGFLYGKHSESLKYQSKKYDELSNEELENKKDVSLYKEEPKDSSYLKKELDRERETKRKLVEQYESELSYLKSLLNKNQANYNDQLVRQEKTQKLFEEMSNELGPTVQIVNGSQELSDEEIQKAIDEEIDQKFT